MGADSLATVALRRDSVIRAESDRMDGVCFEGFKNSLLFMILVLRDLDMVGQVCHVYLLTAAAGLILSVGFSGLELAMSSSEGVGVILGAAIVIDRWFCRCFRTLSRVSPRANDDDASTGLCCGGHGHVLPIIEDFLVGTKAR